MFATCFVLGWTAMLVLFVVGHSRWMKRMISVDKAEQLDHEQYQIVSAGVRPYPE